MWRHGCIDWSVDCESHTGSCPEKLFWEVDCWIYFLRSNNTPDMDSGHWLHQRWTIEVQVSDTINQMVTFLFVGVHCKHGSSSCSKLKTLKGLPNPTPDVNRPFWSHWTGVDPSASTDGWISCCMPKICHKNWLAKITASQPKSPPENIPIFEYNSWNESLLKIFLNDWHTKVDWADYICVAE